MKRKSIAFLLVAGLTLGGCGTLDQLVADATSWLNDARSSNTFSELDEGVLNDIDDDTNDDATNRPAFRDDDAGFSGERDSDEYLFDIAGVNQLQQKAIGEIDRDDGRLYIEFEPNDAFIAVTPTGGGVTPTEITLTADPNFGASGDEFTIVLDRTTGFASMTRNGTPVALVVAGSGSQLRVVGVDLDGNGRSDVDLYSEDSQDGRFQDDDDDDEYERDDDDYDDYYDS
jgi:hypothetical protein